MPEMNIRDLADVLELPVEEFMQHLRSAGIEAESADVPMDQEQKTRLLLHLRASRGSTCVDIEPRRISLKRKTLSEIKIPISTQMRGKVRYRNVSVEFRRTRTYVRRDVLEHEDVMAREEAERRGMEEEARQLDVEAAEAAAALEQAREQAPPDETREEAAPPPEAEVGVEAVPAVEAAHPQEPEQEPEQKQEQELEQEQEQEPEQEQEQEPEQESQTSLAAAEQAEESPAAPEAAAPPPVNMGFGKDKLRVDTNKVRRRTRKRRLQATVVTAAGGRQHTFQRPTAPVVREVEIPTTITVGELAARMSVKAQEVIKLLMNLGTMVTINQGLDQETASLVVEEVGHKPILRKSSSVAEQIGELTDEQQGETQPRPPVVTVMGHVDHGKTSLLDYLRHTRVAGGEAGGITQHIGSYQVETPHGPVTFLDTPGHEAFGTLRARGVKVTDIVVLIVAADDGVKPQTREAVQYARAARVPIIVAVNKMDKPGMDIERVQRELADLELVPESWGGETMCLPISAKTGEGVEALLEALHLQAEMLELRAPVGVPASGVVLESSVDRSQGPVCTVLVRGGILRPGDMLLAGHSYGRLRVLRDEQGRPVTEAGPARSVRVLGLNSVPRSGDSCLVLQDEKKARELAEARAEESRDAKLARPRAALASDNLLERMGKPGEPVGTVLNLLLRADVHGSVEALSEAIGRLSREGKVRVELIAGSVGAITESDIDMARTFKARIIGFNVRAVATARALAEGEGVKIHYYSVIYEAIEDLEKIVEGMVEPERREHLIGVAEVRDVFVSSKLGAIAGCLVVEGEVRSKLPIRVLRNDIVIYEGELESLRRFKEDVNKVPAGTECGIGVKNYQDVKSGDRIETFEWVTERRSV